MPSETSTDIAIIGGGLIGLSLALLLDQMGVSKTYKTTIIYADSTQATQPTQTQTGLGFDPRVVALSRSSQQILNKAGAWQAVENDRLCPYTSMYVWDGEGTANIRFSSDDVDEAYLGCIVENSVLIRALSQQLESSTSVQSMKGQSMRAIVSGVDSEGRERHSVTLQDDSIVHAKLIIGADGIHSPVRQSMNFETRAWDYQQTAIVTTVETERSHDFCAWQRFSSVGPLAFLPLSKHGDDTRHCSIVWSLDTAEAERYMAADDAEIKQALAAAIEHRLGEIVNIDTRVAVPLKQQFATRYIQAGCALVGDAAHAIHPLAGQGANLGLYDAYALAKALLRTAERGLDCANPAGLRRYERARQPHNMMAMATMEAFKRGFGSTHPYVGLARNRGMQFANNCASLRALLAKLALGSSIDADQ